MKTWFKWEYIFWYSRKRENFRYHVYMAFLIEKTIYIMLAVFFFSRHISISFYISFSNSSWFGSPKLIVKFSPVDIESKKKPSNQAIKNFSKNSASFNSKRERKKNHSFWWLYSLYVRRITRVCFCKLVNKRNEKKKRKLIKTMFQNYVFVTRARSLFFSFISLTVSGALNISRSFSFPFILCIELTHSGTT